MNVDRENKVADIKGKLTQGSYCVDPKLVADAIVQRLELIAVLRAGPADLAAVTGAGGDGGDARLAEVLRMSARSRPVRRAHQ